MAFGFAGNCILEMVVRGGIVGEVEDKIPDHLSNALCKLPLQDVCMGPTLTY